MCGRYQFGTTDADIASAFDAIALPVGLRPRYNVAPTDPVPVILNREGPRIVQLVRWGLVPHWAKDPTIGAQMINARVETVATKPAYRDAFARRRCLVVADGFYEWKRQGKRRTPFRVCRKDRAPLAFAGIWGQWKNFDDTWLTSCSIITCVPNELVAPLHNRMPLILKRDDYERWLHPSALPREALDDLLVTPPSDDLEMYQVSSLVNSVRNDTTACIERDEPAQQTLF